MDGFLIYVLIADMLTALILFLVTSKDRSIDDHCSRIGVDVSKVVLVGILIGFILLPIAILRAISGLINTRG